MKIITVNLPEAYLKTMDKSIGDKGCYPSRSEFIRVAVREFLMKELESVKTFQMQKKEPTNPNADLIQNQNAAIKDNSIIQIPIADAPGTFQTFRIIKK